MEEFTAAFEALIDKCIAEKFTKPGTVHDSIASFDSQINSISQTLTRVSKELDVIIKHSKRMKVAYCESPRER